MNGFGKSRYMNSPEEIKLTEAGIAKAQRNRTIFNRALSVLMKEYSMSREDVLHWLDDDEQFNEASSEFQD